MTNINKKISQDQFDSIADLRPYLLQHPDGKMVESACLHYLGDEMQQYYEVVKRKMKIQTGSWQILEEVSKITGKPVYFTMLPFCNLNKSVVKTESYDYSEVLGHVYVYVKPISNKE
jgi:hypothetical protein